MKLLEMSVAAEFLTERVASLLFLMLVGTVACLWVFRNVILPHEVGQQNQKKD